MNTYFEVKQVRQKQRTEAKKAKKAKEEDKEEKEEKTIAKFVSEYNQCVKKDSSISYDQVSTLVNVANVSVKTLRNIMRHNKYADDGVIRFDLLFKNPYQFSRIFPTLLTHKKAENIEVMLHIPESQIPVDDRMASFVISVLTHSLNSNNDTYMTKKYLYLQIKKELERNKKKIFENKISGREQRNNAILSNNAIIMKSINTLTIERCVYFDYESKFNGNRRGYRAKGITLKTIHDVERGCHNIINEQMSGIPSSEEVGEIPESVKKLQKFTFTDEQEVCFRNAINYPLSVICGPPGSGKTAIIIGINDYFTKFSGDHLVINLAYCGKAVRNVKYHLRHKKYRASSRCYTLHKFLYHEIYKDRSIDDDDDDDDASLPDDYTESVIIVDESSMICLTMFSRLLDFVVKNKCTLIFVGDDEQLPPIGLGNPFQTLLNFIHSGRLDIPFMKLTKVHRNGDEVKQMLQHIKSKEFPSVAGSFYSNKKDVPVLNIYDITCSFDAFDEYVNTLDKDLLMRPNNTLFLVAEHEGDLGRIAINRKLQKYINYKSKSKENLVYRYFNEKMYDGDKVLRTTNNYTRTHHRYNGDEGIVIKIKSDSKRVVIKYWNEQNNDYGNMRDGVITYDEDFEETISVRELKEEFKLGYCRTVHKSQGGEADNVVIVGPVRDHYSWTSFSGKGIKLLRVALSRVKKGCIHMFCHPDVIPHVLDKEEHLSTTGLFEYFD